MAAIGKAGVHKVIGYFCDLCGQECEGDKEELNALGCTYPSCDESASVYHQDCIEKYLRRIGLEKNRKTGYPCPRGSGKHSKFCDAPCRGRVTKSHPIHIRNEQAKKRQKAKPADPVPIPANVFKGKGKSKVGDVEVKVKAKAADPVAKSSGPAKTAQAKDRPKAAGPQGKDTQQQPAPKPLSVAKVPQAKPKNTPMDRDQVKDAVYKAKLELGLKASPPSKASKAAPTHANADRQGLPHAELNQGAPSGKATAVTAQPAVSAWQRNHSTQPPVERIASPGQAAVTAHVAQTDSPVTPTRSRGMAAQQRSIQNKAVHKHSAAQADTGGSPVPVQAAASPMTPNAIKAFQPQHPVIQTDVTMSEDTLSYSAEHCLESSCDRHSTCSDEVSDALFAMDHSSDSEMSRQTAAQRELAFSTGPEYESSTAMLGSPLLSGAKSLPMSPNTSGFPAYSSYESDSGSNTEPLALCDTLNQQFQQALALQKAIDRAARYQQLGFSQPQSIAAVNIWGDNEHEALMWLLRGHELQLQEMIPNSQATFDISQELRFLDNCQSALGVPRELLQLMVVDAQGSMRDLVGMLRPWTQEACAHDVIRGAVGTNGLPQGAVKTVPSPYHAVMPDVSGGLEVGPPMTINAPDSTQCNGHHVYNERQTRIGI